VGGDEVRVLVCGGRRYNDRSYVFAILDELEPVEVIHGAAAGADALAEAWAKSRQIPYRGFPAEWDKSGKSAGHKRNYRMLTDTWPDLVVAFPGGAGTADMIRTAQSLGVPVLQV
jgi:SLOG family YspA-like protein